VVQRLPTGLGGVRGRHLKGDSERLDRESKAIECSARTSPRSQPAGDRLDGHDNGLRYGSEWAFKVTTVLNARILTGPRPEPPAR
jgi:hypothetical protein